MAKAKVSGPIFEPTAAAALRSILGAVAKAQGVALEVDIKANTPTGVDRTQHKAGALRKSVKVRTTIGKRSIKITATASARNAQGFCYGAALEKDTGFMSEVIQAAADDVVAAIGDGVADFIQQANDEKLAGAAGATPGASSVEA